MSPEPLDVAQRAISDVARALGVEVSAVQVAWLAGAIVGALAGGAWQEAERAGAEAAEKIITAADADAAARARR